MTLFDHLEKLVPARFNAYRERDLVTRLISDIDGLQFFPLRVLFPVASGLIGIVAVSTLSWFLIPLAGYILFASLLLAGIVSFVVTYSAVRLGEQASAHASAELKESLNQFLDGALDIACLNASQNVTKTIQSHISAIEKVESRRTVTSGMATFSTTLIQGIATILTFSVATDAFRHGHIDGVLVAVLTLLPLAAFEVTASFPTAAASYFRAQGHAKRINEILDTDPDYDGSEKEIHHKPSSMKLTEAAAHWPLNPESTLSNISCELTQSEHLAVIGESGSGKSTFAAMLVKSLPLTQGVYLIDGIDSAALPGESIRTHFISTGVESHIFATSLRNNLLCAARRDRPEVSDDVLIESLTKAQLDNWFNSLPRGLDTVIGELGMTMSGGQAQRLKIARMFVAQPDVWVLDEPTEYLDDHLADLLLSAIRGEVENRMFILLTHRMLDSVLADKILMLRNGRQIAFDTPKTLQEEVAEYRYSLTIAEEARKRVAKAIRKY